MGIVKDKIQEALNKTEKVDVDAICKYLDLTLTEQDIKYIKEQPNVIELLQQRYELALKNYCRFVCSETLKDCSCYIHEKYFVECVKECIKADFPTLQVACDYEGLKIWDDEFMFLFERN